MVVMVVVLSITNITIFNDRQLTVLVNVYLNSATESTLFFGSGCRYGRRLHLVLPPKQSPTYSQRIKKPQID